jgi:hypothetical protein
MPVTDDTEPMGAEWEDGAASYLGVWSWRQRLWRQLTKRTVLTFVAVAVVAEIVLVVGAFNGGSLISLVLGPLFIAGMFAGTVALAALFDRTDSESARWRAAPGAMIHCASRGRLAVVPSRIRMGGPIRVLAADVEPHVLGEAVIAALKDSERIDPDLDHAPRSSIQAWEALLAEAGLTRRQIAGRRAVSVSSDAGESLRIAAWRYSRGGWEPIPDHAEVVLTSPSVQDLGGAVAGRLEPIEQEYETVSVEMSVKASVFQENLRRDVLAAMETEDVTEVEDLDTTVLTTIVVQAAGDAGLSEDDARAIARAEGLPI